jgi:signal transduction histidine kinase
VRERTAALRREVAERKRLNAELQQITSRERERIGQELHDSLCQHLTGTALVAQAVAAELRSRKSPRAGEAEHVVKLVEQGIDMSRDIARGLFTPELAAAGLGPALEALANETSHLGEVTCTFEMLGQVNGAENATQLYRIAHEAVTNALKHAKARTIQIQLQAADSETTLTIADDGVGICSEPLNKGGLGLSLMRHGAAAINADLQVRRGAKGGTIVTCHVRGAS